MGMTGSLDAWREAARTMDGPHGPIAWWEAGSGEPLLLVHGFPTASWDWAKVWDRLAAERRVIALDMLGFGLSAKPAKHVYRLTEQADLQEQLCAELGIAETDALVHDYGVSVAEELLARQRDGQTKLRLESVCYLNGGLIPGAHRPRPIQHLMAGPLGPLISLLMSRKRFGASFSEVFGPDTQPDQAELDDFWALITHNDGNRRSHQLIRYMADRLANKERWVGALAANVVRQRFICGALDPVSGAHLAAAYRETVPEPDVVLLDDVGHYPQWEAPDRVLEHWRAFAQRSSHSP